MHIGTGYAYYYWAFVLIKYLKLLQNLNYLFISNLDELVAYYDLDRESTKKFIKKAELYRFRMKFMIVSFELFFELVIIRCCYFAFLNLENYYVYTIGLFFMVVSLFLFHIITFVSLRTFVIIFVSIEFLILRMAQIEKIIMKEFKNRKLSTSSRKAKRDQSILKIIKYLGEFANQFDRIDKINDSLISITTLGSLLASFCFLYFLIFTNDMLIVFKMLILILFITNLIVICSSISYYADHFKRKVIEENFFLIIELSFSFFFLSFQAKIKFNRLELKIHHLIPLLNGFEAKLHLNNFLILNNQHQGGITFTFLKSLKHFSNSIIEVLYCLC